MRKKFEEIDSGYGAYHSYSFSSHVHLYIGLNKHITNEQRVYKNQLQTYKEQKVDVVRN